MKKNITGSTKGPEKFDFENLKPCYLYVSADESMLLDKLEEIRGFLRNKLDFETDFMELDFSEDGIEEQYDNFITMPSMFSARKFMIIENTDKAPVGLQKKIAGIIPAEVNENRIVFFLTSSRGKLAPVLMKAIEEYGTVKKLNKPLASDLKKWLDGRASGDGLKFTDDARELLIENVNADPGLLKREYSKLYDYICSEDHKIINRDMVDNLVSRVYSLKIFDLVDLLGQRDKAGSIKALASLMKDEQNPIGLITLIHRMFKSMLYIKSESGSVSVSGYIEKYLNASPYFIGKLVSKYIKFSGNYSHEEIIRIFDILNRYDISFRSGNAGDKNLLKIMISEIVDVRT
ncbi:MAG: hypothetical protein JW770_01175 [Actinobacteria bacterium]|nr:hypothetical protein [Actinomycetota bacterium]